MALITPDEVKEIINGCILTDDQIDPFILGAHLYLNKIFTNDQTLSTGQRKEIERWFTAHLITSTGFQSLQTVKKEKIGDAEIEYSVNTKAVTGLAATPYGAMAIQYDTSGLLAKAGKMKARIYAVKARED